MSLQSLYSLPYLAPYKILRDRLFYPLGGYTSLNIRNIPSRSTSSMASAAWNGGEILSTVRIAAPP